jgi:hypothetical protein
VLDNDVRVDPGALEVLLEAWKTARTPPLPEAISFKWIIADTNEIGGGVTCPWASRF